MVSRRHFRVLLYPALHRFGTPYFRIRFRAYCDWYRERGAPSLTIPDSVLLAPDLPFSFLPSRWATHLHRRIAMQAVPDAASGITPGPAWGLGTCLFRIAAFTFAERHCLPAVRMAQRTFHPIFLHGNGMTPGDPPDSSPLLGTDFLYEQSARIVVDYGLLAQRASGPDFDTAVPCGYVRFPR